MSEPYTEEEVQAAEKRWAEEIACWPPATQVRFDGGMHRIVVSLKTGLDLLLDPQNIRGFENAPEAELSQVEVEASGYALHFPLIDEGIWLPSIYADAFAGVLRLAAAQELPEHAIAA